MYSFCKSDLLEQVCGDYTRFIKQSMGLESRNFKPKLNKFIESVEESVESVFKRYPEGPTMKEMVEFRREIIK